MKTLVCIPHYYDRSKKRHAVMGSSQDDLKARGSVVDYCLRQIMSILSPTKFLLGTFGDGDRLVVNNKVSTIENRFPGDVCVLTFEDEHLLDQLSVAGYRKFKPSLRDPAYLPYACRTVFAEQQDAYDLFFYIEDDTVPLDSAFFAKLAGFSHAFGNGVLLLPHRYELFGNLSAKAYLEQPSPHMYQIAAETVAEPRLSLGSFAGETHFDLTRSWGAGCFAITREQLKLWMKSPDFHRPRGDMNIMIMEQAMLPMSGRYPMYKPAVENIDFLEVHHVPNRACHARTPFHKIKGLIESAQQAADRGRA